MYFTRVPVAYIGIRCRGASKHGGHIGDFTRVPLAHRDSLTCALANMPSKSQLGCIPVADIGICTVAFVEHVRHVGLTSLVSQLLTSGFAATAFREHAVTWLVSQLLTSGSAEVASLNIPFILVTVGPAAQLGFGAAVKGMVEVLISQVAQVRHAQEFFFVVVCGNRFHQPRDDHGVLARFSVDVAFVDITKAGDLSDGAIAPIDGEVVEEFGTIGVFFPKGFKG